MDFVQINCLSSQISATTTSARVAYPVVGQSGVRVYNAGSVPVFLQSGDSTVVASTAAPRTFLPPGAIEVFNINTLDTHLAAITASSTATVYFQPTTGR